MRTRALAGLLCVVALVGGACGRGDQTPQEIVFASASTTSAAKSSRMVITMDVSDVAGDAGVGEITGEGVFDYEEQAGRLTLTMPIGEDQPAAEFEIVLMGKTMYQRFPAEMAAFLGGKPWVKIDLDALTDSTGVDLGAFSSAQSADPTQALAQLRGVSDDVTEVGEEKLRGETVTHYRLTIDLNKAVEEAPEAQQELMRKAVEQLGSTEIPAEVWIDDDGRLRKFVQNTELPDQGSVAITMELFDFGTDVDVEAPPADQVTDLSALMGRVQSGTNEGSGSDASQD